ncbi:MAG: DUF5711 family protein [Oscillospiraceae bacterium]|nr:DUF5711 family protein [Oscillospiraceae bacterium]
MPRNPNDILAYRKKSKRKSRIYKFIAVFMVIFIIFFIWTNGTAVFEPFRDIARYFNKSESEEGFPIAVSGSASFSLNRFGQNFLLLNDTYLNTYTDKGGQLLAFRHNYANPVQRVTNKRILLYNFNSYEFSLFNRNSRIYEIKLDEKIVLAELGNNDMAAVVTSSTAFSNILHIYDDDGKWRYTKRFIDEEVNAVTFTSKSNEIIVVTVSARNGEIISKAYRLRTDTATDDIVWEQTLPADALALNVYENKNYINILADNMIISLNSSDGEIAGSYQFNDGNLLKPPVFSADFNLIILNDYITKRALYVTLDEQCNLISSKMIPFEVKKVEISGEIVYTLSGSAIIRHDKFLQETNATAIEDEYRDFIILNKNALLLGYEAIEQIAVN